MYKKHLNKIKDTKDVSKMIELEDIFIELMEHIKECDKKLYEKIELKMYKIAYGKHLTEEMAVKWVNNMKPVGQHWSIPEAEEIILNKGYLLDKINFYTVINMMYNDNHNIVKDNDDLAFELAKNWLEDEDAVKDKLFEYWEHIPKKD